MSLAPLERTDTIVETEPGHGEPRYAHIVFPKTVLPDAMINGTPVTALCGHTWVPGRDATKYPLCPKCKEIWDTLDKGDVPDA